MGVPGRLRCACLLLALLGSCATTAVQSARSEWFEAKSDRFEVLAEGHPEEARELVRDLELFHQVMLAKSNAEERTGTPPLHIFVARSRASFDALARMEKGVSGVFKAGVRGTYAIARRADVADDEGVMSTRHILFHEYVHHIMAASGSSVPSWYNEGLAEYMATTRFRDDGSYTVGCPPVYRTRWFEHRRWLPMERLMSADDIRHFPDEYDAYAQAWYTVHYLSGSAERQAQLQEYLELVRRVPNEVAVEHAFGMDMESFEEAIRRHASARDFQCAAITPAIPLDEPRVRLGPLSAEDAHVRLGDLMLNTLGPTDETLALLEQALTVARGRHEAHVNHIRGELWASAREGEEGLTLGALERAERRIAGLGERARTLPLTEELLGWVYAEQARLLHASRSPAYAAKLKLARKAYRRAIRGDESFAPAYYGLGATYAIEDNGSKEPLVVLEAAGYLMPMSVEVPLTLANILVERKDYEAAEQPVRYVLQWAKNPEFRAAAERFLEQLPVRAAVEGARAAAAAQEPAGEPAQAEPEVPEGGTSPEVMAELENITADTASAAPPACAERAEPLPKQPTRVEILGAIGVVQAAVTRCFETPGVHELSLQLSGKTGRVIAVAVAGSAAVQRCVSQALRPLCVPPFAAESFSVKFPLRR